MMKKHEVELIIIGVIMGKEQILYMKIYKDGTLIRSGCGGMPTVPISGMTVEGSKEYWEQLIAFIDEKIVETPIVYQDENITQPLEYFIAFFGESSNGETGERAKWTKTSGVRFLLDSNTNFRHPLLGFIDSFAIKAAEITNEWYFDIMMSAIYNLQPVHLNGTFVSMPKSEEKEKQEFLSLYVHQIMENGPRGWDIVKIGNGRKYKTTDGTELTASVVNNVGKVSINFFEKVDLGTADQRLMELVSLLEKEGNTTPTESSGLTETTTSEGKHSKNWWEFWK
ncbi:MAG TPA: hypothetical protein PK198_21125 [Saprospiraceae bacterium]|nr:hypothetical protein [Saprospiraceae bacterium]HRK80766.1 hypothetical protein [Saprospiraceae bacterium]